MRCMLVLCWGVGSATEECSEECESPRNWPLKSKMLSGEVLGSRMSPDGSRSSCAGLSCLYSCFGPGNDNKPDGESANLTDRVLLLGRCARDCRVDRSSVGTGIGRELACSCRTTGWTNTIERVEPVVIDRMLMLLEAWLKEMLLADGDCLKTARGVAMCEECREATLGRPSLPLLVSNSSDARASHDLNSSGFF